MSAHDLIQKAADSGVVLYLDGETLKARGSRQAVENLSPELRAHKVEVVALLANTRMAANDPSPATEPQDFDRWCWPHGEAMSRREIEVFMKRDSQFQRRGMSAEEAEKLADKLVKRDRDYDDRRLCLECQNLTGRPGAWRCGQQRVGADWVVLPKRCDSFGDVHR